VLTFGEPFFTNTKENEMLVITRHEAYVALLRERGIIQSGGYKVVTHALPEDVKGKDIVTSGLPVDFYMAARSATVVPLRFTQKMRQEKKELDLDSCRQIAGETIKFKLVALE